MQPEAEIRPTHLSDFHLDLLAIITAFIDGHSLCALWMSGCSVLNRKLANGGVTKFTVIYGNTRRSLEVKWPTLVANFLHLRQFRAIWDSSLDRKRKLQYRELENLPVSIESIELYIPEYDKMDLASPMMFSPTFDPELNGVRRGHKGYANGAVFSKVTSSPAAPLVQPSSSGSSDNSASSSSSTSAPAPAEAPVAAAPKKAFSFGQNALPASVTPSAKPAAAKKHVYVADFFKPAPLPTSNKPNRLAGQPKVKIPVTAKSVAAVTSVPMPGTVTSVEVAEARLRKFPNLRRLVLPECRFNFTFPDTLQTLCLRFEAVSTASFPSTITKLTMATEKGRLLDFTAMPLLNSLTLFGDGTLRLLDLAFLPHLESLDLPDTLSIVPRPTKPAAEVVPQQQQQQQQAQQAPAPLRHSSAPRIALLSFANVLRLETNAHLVCQAAPPSLTSLKVRSKVTTSIDPEILQQMPQNLLSMHLPFQDFTLDIAAALPRSLTRFRVHTVAVACDLLRALPPTLTFLSAYITYQMDDHVADCFSRLTELQHLDLQKSELPVSPSVLPLKLHTLGDCSIGDVVVGLGKHSRLTSVQLWSSIDLVIPTAEDFPPYLRRLELQSVAFISPAILPRSILHLTLEFNVGMDHPVDWMSQIPPSVTTFTCYRALAESLEHLPPTLRHFKARDCNRDVSSATFKKLPRELKTVVIQYQGSTRGSDVADLPPTLELATFSIPGIGPGVIGAKEGLLPRLARLIWDRK